MSDKKQIKIGFVGSHGTGKTTLVSCLQDHLTQCNIKSCITPEIPRIICDINNDQEFFQRHKNTIVKQLLLLVGQPIYELESYDSGYTVVLCDRALLDHWAYTRYLFRETLKSDNAIEIVDEFVTRYCQSYDYIFYLPIEFKPIADGIREGDSDFQKNIDEEIKELLTKLSIKHHTLTGTVSERVSQVIETILPRIKTLEVSG